MSMSMKRKCLLRQVTMMFQTLNNLLVMLIRKCWNKWRVKTRQKLNLRLQQLEKLIRYYHQRDKELYMT